MGLITASVMGTISTGIATMPLPVPALVVAERPLAYKLMSELMPLDGLLIHVSTSHFSITRQFDATIRSAMLASFEHRYDL